MEIQGGQANHPKGHSQKAELDFKHGHLAPLLPSSLCFSSPASLTPACFASAKVPSHNALPGKLLFNHQDPAGLPSSLWFQAEGAVISEPVQCPWVSPLWPCPHHLEQYLCSAEVTADRPCCTVLASSVPLAGTEQAWGCLAGVEGSRHRGRATARSECSPPLPCGKFLHLGPLFLDTPE